MPIASTISAGVIVTARRTKSGIWRRMKPCITTWPDSVPTLDDERPEASRAIPKRMFAWLPSVGAEAVVHLARDRRRHRRDRACGRRPAAMISIAALITPASPIAITTSMSSKRKIRRFASSDAPDHALLRQRRVQVDHVRHHGRAEDADRQQHALVARERRDERPSSDVDAVRASRGRPAIAKRERRSRRRARRSPPRGGGSRCACRARIAKAHDAGEQRRRGRAGCRRAG